MAGCRIHGNRRDNPAVAATASSMPIPICRNQNSGVIQTGRGADIAGSRIVNNRVKPRTTVSSVRSKRRGGIGIQEGGSRAKADRRNDLRRVGGMVTDPA